MSKRIRKTKGPKFVAFFGPLLDALRELGDSARPDEAKDLLAKNLNVSQEQQSETLKTGASRFGNQVDWARFYLAKAGLLDSSKRGTWKLTSRGRSTRLSPDESLGLFQTIHRNLTAGTTDEPESATYVKDDGDVSDDELPPIEARHRSRLLDILVTKVTPAGFERLCQLLLRVEGFEQVEITGRSGDGGMDGYGILRINSLVSFKVIFQCKRYSGAISPDKVRDFRGAMAGRADKGIILTTGTFTTAAKAEAVREGVPEINLIDGEGLMKRLEGQSLGLTPKTVYEIDEKFFEEYCH